MLLYFQKGTVMLGFRKGDRVRIVENVARKDDSGDMEVLGFESGSGSRGGALVRLRILGDGGMISTYEIHRGTGEVLYRNYHDES